jgi:hypothetical protein
MTPISAIMMSFFHRAPVGVDANSNRVFPSDRQMQAKQLQFLSIFVCYVVSSCVEQGPESHHDFYFHFCPPSLALYARFSLVSVLVTLSLRLICDGAPLFLPCDVTEVKKGKNKIDVPRLDCVLYISF